MILIDTDVIIEHLRGTSAAYTYLENVIERNEAACSVLTRFEILGGMRSDERGLTRRLLERIDPIPVTREIADRAGELRRAYKRSHSQISAIDYLIAATAELRSARLATLNLRHFPMFPDLTRPFEPR